MYNLSSEKAVFNNGFKFLGAVDEVGRGPLAGPVVSACVVCGPDFEIKDERLLAIKDSKKLTDKKREELYDLIFESFESVSIGIVNEDVIDDINILQATFVSMKQAIQKLDKQPDFILVDGNAKIPNLNIEQKTVIKGDSLVFSIAAASIVAKVYRDRLMREMDEKYPGYNFAKHKGYGTKIHMEALQKIGPCKIHRKSFAPIAKLINERA